MHTLTVKQVPDSIYKGLKNRAERNHRSLNKEVIAILDKTLCDRVDPESFLSETEPLRNRNKKCLDDNLLKTYKDEGR